MNAISSENRANFLAKAAKYNFYTIGNIPQFYFEDDYFKSHFNFKREQETMVAIPETLKKCKYEFGIFANIREQKKNDGSHELYYIDNFSILLFDGCSIVQLLKYKSKYFLHPMYKDINLLTRNLNRSNYGPYTAKIAEPNRIGVFTDKKLTDWFEYCRNYMQALQQCKDDNENKTKANLQRIEDVATALGVESKGHSTYKYIQLKNMEIRFELLDNGNYLKETVVFTGKVDDVVDMFGKIK